MRWKWFTEEPWWNKLDQIWYIKLDRKKIVRKTWYKWLKKLLKKKNFFLPISIVPKSNERYSKPSPDWLISLFLTASRVKKKLFFKKNLAVFGLRLAATLKCGDWSEGLFTQVLDGSKLQLADWYELVCACVCPSSRTFVGQHFTKIGGA